MIIEQKIWTSSKGWTNTKVADSSTFKPQVVFLFGARNALSNNDLLNQIAAFYPESRVIGCSTSGEISGNEVLDESIVISAIQFEKTQLYFAEVHVNDVSETYDAAKRLATQFPTEGLKHVFVLSDGLQVNGTELVTGLREHLPTDIHITGGLAGDGALFQETLVVNQGQAKKNTIAGIGFYGSSLKIGFGSFGGWDSFGIERRVTRSKANILYEIDGSPALALYKSFLGEKAAELPASGLLFPLSMRTQADSLSVVRTILAIDEKEQSITFAGDLPEGSYVKLMKANVDRLINGAEKAAQTSLTDKQNEDPEFAILISCVGRKLVLKQMVEEEVEAAHAILGGRVIQTGFYSYGEISPFSSESKCELHNQTMTITTFKEI